MYGEFQNHWASGLFPQSGILKEHTRGHIILEFRLHVMGGRHLFRWVP